MSWRDFWDGEHAIYVNDRHRDLHYRGIAADIIRQIPGSGAAVLDHGCGEALHAGEVAHHCGRLILCDAAPNVRAAIARRTADEPKIQVIAPEAVEALEPASLDLIVANSLIQYVTRAELIVLLQAWRRLLKPDGRLILADVIPTDVSAVTDVTALLGFAARGGFLLAAAKGLVATFFSPYRKLRATLGLSRYDAAEIEALVAEQGFSISRSRDNFGHNPARMTFIARPR